MTDAAPNISGRVYIVTGCSRGVGLAICKVLHARGAKFAMIARTGAEIAQHAREFSGQALPIACDATDRAGMVEAAAKTAAQFGGIDGIINNAGMSAIAPVERIVEDDLIRMFRVNVVGMLNGVQAVLPHLRKRGGGNIINISSASVHDLSEFPYLGGYAATKAAVERLTQDLRLEISAENIAVTTFVLGSTLTYFGTGWDPKVTEEAFAEWSARGGLAPATMDPALPAEAIVRCLETPPGACADYIQFRPYKSMVKGRQMAG